MGSGSSNFAGSETPASTDAGVRPAHEPIWLDLTLTVWVQIAVIGSLMAMIFWPNLRRIWDKTNPFYGEPNWGHAICVPLVGLFYLYLHRHALRSAHARPAWSGLGILLSGIGLYVYGIWPGQNDFIKDFGMVVCLFGVVTLLGGWAIMKVAWFPILFLLCALPWPGLLYSRVAGPLQALAARVAVKTLQWTNVDASCSGTKIFIEGTNGLRTLNVAEACSGLRSLMTFVAMAAAVAFLTPRAIWQRLIIVASAVPIVIGCNVMRVSGQGLIDHYVSTELSEGFAHKFVGLVMLIPAFFLVLLVAFLVDHILIDAVEDKAELLGLNPTRTPKPAAIARRVPSLAAPRSASLRRRPPGAEDGATR